MTKNSQMEKDLIEIYGPIMTGTELRKALGFGSATSFNRAVRTGKVNLHVFHIPERRGKFALTGDVAKWLSSIGQAKD